MIAIAFRGGSLYKRSMPRPVLRMLRHLPARFRRSSRSQQETFTAIFNTNAWGNAESVSGPGSSEARGEEFRAELVALLDTFQVRSMVDAPCGDFNWMKRLLADRPLA